MVQLVHVVGPLSLLSETERQAGCKEDLGGPVISLGVMYKVGITLDRCEW